MTYTNPDFELWQKWSGHRIALDRNIQLGHSNQIIKTLKTGIYLNAIRHPNPRPRRPTPAFFFLKPLSVKCIEALVASDLDWSVTDDQGLNAFEYHAEKWMFDIQECASWFPLEVIKRLPDEKRPNLSRIFSLLITHHARRDLTSLFDELEASGVPFEDQTGKELFEAVSRLSPIANIQWLLERGQHGEMEIGQHSLMTAYAPDSPQMNHLGQAMASRLHSTLDVDVPAALSRPGAPRL